MNTLDKLKEKELKKVSIIQRDSPSDYMEGYAKAIEDVRKEMHNRIETISKYLEDGGKKFRETCLGKRVYARKKELVRFAGKNYLTGEK